MFPKSDPGLFDASHMTPNGMNLSDVCFDRFQIAPPANARSRPFKCCHGQCLFQIHIGADTECSEH